MTNKEKLFESFGEFVYVVAKADGEVQDVEKKKLHDLISGHPWAKEIEWSFNYETSKDHRMEDIYKKVLDAFQEYGPCPDYEDFIYIVEEVAKSSNGIDDNERMIIEQFRKDLLERLSKGVDKR